MTRPEKFRRALFACAERKVLLRLGGGGEEQNGESIFRDTRPGSCILSRMFPCHSPPLMLSRCSVVHTHPLLLFCNRVPDSSEFFPPSSRFDDLVSRHDTPKKLSNCFLNFVRGEKSLESSSNIFNYCTMVLPNLLIDWKKLKVILNAISKRSCRCSFNWGSCLDTVGKHHR